MVPCPVVCVEISVRGWQRFYCVRRSERWPRTFDSYRLSQHDHRWVAGSAAFMARWKKEISADSRIPATRESRLGPHGGVVFMVDPTLRAVARTCLDKVAAFSEEPKSLAGRRARRSK